MNNEFGKDMNDGPSKSKNGRRREMERVMDQAQNFRRSQLDGIVSKRKHRIKHQSVKFVLASIEYGSVKSSRVLHEYNEKRKIVLQNGLCNKCLEKGQIAKNCPKTNFKCLEVGCG